MQKFYTYILLTILTIVASSSLKAQPAMTAYVDLYAAETLQGKGVLYLQLDQSKTSLSEILARYNEESNPLVKVLRTYPKFIPGNQLVLLVCGQNESSYHLSSYDKFASYPNIQPDSECKLADGGQNSKNTKHSTSLWVSKKELLALGFQYIPLEKLVAFYKANPALLQDMLGTELPVPAYVRYEKIPKDGAEYFNSRHFILREQPDESSNFVFISTPCGLSGDKKVLSKNGEWFHLQLHIRCIFNASRDPMECARAQFDQQYEGFWKAPCDENGFPYLLVETLSVGSGSEWEMAADYAKGKNRLYLRELNEE